MFYPAIEVIGALSTAMIIWFGGSWVLEGTLTLGSFVAFILYSQRFYRPISDLSEKFNILQAAMASSERIFKLLDTDEESSRDAGADAEREPTPCPRAHSAAHPHRAKREGCGHIVFDDVTFAYNGTDSGACRTCRSK